MKPKRNEIKKKKDSWTCIFVNFFAILHNHLEINIITHKPFNVDIHPQIVDINVYKYLYFMDISQAVSRCVSTSDDNVFGWYYVLNDVWCVLRYHYPTNKWYDRKNKLKKIITSRREAHQSKSMFQTCRYQHS